MAFDTEIQALAGTATQTEMDQWMTDGAKEIIHVLPLKLKAKCSTVSTLNNSATTLDVDSKGDILHVTRLSANSSGYHLACREIPPMYGGSAEDSSNMMYYATPTDPVYWIDSSSGVSTLKVKPDPEATQVSLVHHITYPTINASDVSTIANFPDEAEYLVVLYAAAKVLENKMTELHDSLPVHSDQDGTHTAPGGFTGNSSGSQGWEAVRYWIETEEDSEMASVNMQALNTEMQQFVGEYQWYESRLAGIKRDYVQGLQLLATGDARNLVASGTRKATEGQKVSA